MTPSKIFTFEIITFECMNDGFLKQTTKWFFGQRRPCVARGFKCYGASSWCHMHAMASQINAGLLMFCFCFFSTVRLSLQDYQKISNIRIVGPPRMESIGDRWQRDNNVKGLPMSWRHHDVIMSSSWTTNPARETMCVICRRVIGENLNFSDLIRHSDNTVLRIYWERCVIWTTKGHCTKNDMSYFRKQHTHNHMCTFLHRSSPFTTIGTKCNVQSLKYDVHTFYCNCNLVWLVSWVEISDYQRVCKLVSEKFSGFGPLVLRWCFDNTGRQATGLDAWASRVKCPARFVSHLHDICIYMSCS